MLGFITRVLEEKGFESHLASYIPFSICPKLSVPFFTLPLGRYPGKKQYICADQWQATGMGAWFPELEFTHYWPTRNWRNLIDQYKYHILVSGNCLGAWPFFKTGRPFLAWVATSWHEDRKERVDKFPWYRKLLDAQINSRFLRRQERMILNSGIILALSRYTRRSLELIGGLGCVTDVMPMPVDLDKFRPNPDQIVSGRIGFTGRLDDPRKNIGLLLEAVALLRDRGLQISVDLIGSNPTNEIVERIHYLQIESLIHIIGPMSHNELAHRLRMMDIFVIPSHQEGLCISGLEALASGCPVISTRCGGPEEFIHENQNGVLIDHNPEALAIAIAQILNNPRLRQELARGARKLVEERYSYDNSREKFWRAFYRSFPSAKID